jgi:hypothetical protein
VELFDESITFLYRLGEPLDVVFGFLEGLVGIFKYRMVKYGRIENE